MNRSERPTSTDSPRRIAALAATLTFALAAAAQCGSTTSPSSDPFKSCPHGYARVDRPASGSLSKPYVCEKL